MLWLLLCAMPSPPSEDVFVDRVKPFVEQHCVECHSGERPRSGLDLERLLSREKSEPAVRADWEAVREVLSFDEMPPEDQSRPDAQASRLVLQWIGDQFDLDPLRDAPTTGGTAQAGRVTLRRLNRFEYQNTIRDLLGFDYRANENFPRDQVASGFDKIADALAMPDVLFEKYLFAAEEIAQSVISVVDLDNPPAVLIEAEQLNGRNFRVRDGVRSMHTNGAVSATLRVEEPGLYRVRIRATASQAGPDLALMELQVDGERTKRFEVDAHVPELGSFEHELRLLAGEHEFGAAFTNDYYKPEDPDPNNRDRNLYVQSIELAGPVGAYHPTDFQDALRDRFPRVRDAVAELARRALRRPVDPEEVKALLALSPPSADWPDVVRLALTALLASPQFLFKVELDRGAEGANQQLSDYELATRLSYFLWSSMPDEPLFQSCERAELHQPEVLLAQVRRMLRDPRASVLATDFAAQWLKSRNLDDAFPDRERFQNWTDSLRDAMREETRLFFESILREDRPVSELIDANFTFLNEELARHYAIGGVLGTHMRRVRIPDAQRQRRGGLLMHAGLLTANSNPTRTSPVLRGKWILETLLGAAPPPPPPGVGDLPEGSAIEPSASLRDRMEQHRADPSCAVCHNKMDALGFSLEHYDAIGAWREYDGRFQVDSSAELPDGRSLSGAADLRALLFEDRALLTSLTRALTIYALGRDLTRTDRSSIRTLVKSLPKHVTLREVIEQVVLLDVFRMRTSEGLGE